MIKNYTIERIQIENSVRDKLLKFVLKQNTDFVNLLIINNSQC
jgi:hypothetical protein